MSTSTTTPAEKKPFADDLLEREHFARKFERYLRVEHMFVETSLVVSLHAPFGAGKSTFLRLWADDLRERRKKDDLEPRVIVVNAWETDYCGDPLVALISALKDALVARDDPKRKPKEAKKLKEAMKDLGHWSLKMANDVAANATGADPIAAREYAEAQRAQRAKDAPGAYDALEVFERRRGALAHLKQGLREAFGGDKVNAIVIIDELDRCRPDYAVSYLETIKHVFDQRGLAFVLGVDLGQLRSAVKVLFGPELHFDEYYRKFSHRTVHLPTPIAAQLSKLTQAYVDRYFHLKEIRTAALSHANPAGMTALLFTMFELTPRQAQEVFRIVGHVLSAEAASEATSRLNFFQQAVVFMAVLRIADPAAYRKLGSRDAKPADLVPVLQRSEDLRFRVWWYDVFCAGMSRAITKEVVTEQSYQEGLSALGTLVTGPKGMLFVEAQSYRDGWGAYRLRDVYWRIEGLRNFEVQGGSPPEVDPNAE